MPPAGSKVVSDTERGCIIGLRIVAGLEFHEIATLLGLGSQTPGNIFRTAASKATTENLKDMLAAVHKKASPGRPPIVRNGTALSARIRAAIIEFGMYDIETAVSDVIHEAGLTLSRKTVRNIAHEHRDATHPKELVRGVRTVKPPLNDSARVERIDYSQWLIDELNLHYPKLVYVCYDETSKPIGAITRKQFQWRQKGNNANTIPVHVNSQPAFSLMICAATSTDTLTGVRPCIIWAKDTNEGRDIVMRRVMEANKKATEQMNKKIERAKLPGTNEYTALRQINQNIAHDNHNIRARNREIGLTGGAISKGTKRPRQPEQEYKVEEFAYKDGKGMSGLWYAEYVLKDKGFPYYKLIRERNQGNYVYLVQDNVHLHKLGLRYCKPEIEADKIEFAPHPPNSPDLHPIELCFGKLGDYLSQYDSVGSSSQARAEAEEYVRWVWQEDEEMRQFMAQKLHPQSFADTAALCIQADGWNNFTA